MHWINIISNKDYSVEYQLHLNDYFENNDFNEDIVPIVKKNNKELNNDNKDYQELLELDIVYKDVVADENNETKDNNNYINYKQTKLLKIDFLNDEDLESDIMGNNNHKNEQDVDSFYMGVNTLSNKPIKKPKILISPDNRITLVNKQCPYCKYVGGHYHDFYEKQIKKENGIKDIFKVNLYKCPNCGNTYGPYTYKKINATLKDKINIDERIRECYAKTGLSYDKIVEMVQTFYDISISHQYIKNVIEKPVDGFEETQRFVELPIDNKINGKTSEERKVTDIVSIYMFKRNDVDYSGEITVNEVFLRVMGNKQYLVSIMDHSISDMPIALAVIPTRKFEVMMAVFDFVFENSSLVSLTSDMFGVYGKIADEENIPHQECIFHSMFYVGSIIHKELSKKDEYDVREKVWINSLFTEYKEILRQLTYGDAVDKMESFLNKLDVLPGFFEKIGKHLRKHFVKLFTHLHDDSVVRTSNECETFNSLPQIKRTKNISKTPQGLIRRLACIVKYYTPNKRTLQKRGDWHILPQ